jgi:hypothetical protein
MIMQKKKKTNRVGSPSAQALERKEPSPVSELIEQCRTVAPEQLVSQIPSPDVARVLVENLPLDDPAAASVLIRLGESFSDRQVRKAIRRAVFRMRQKGMLVPPELEREPGEPILKRPAEVLDPLALLGPIDRLGNRGVLVALPNRTIGYDLGFGAVGDTEGFVFFKAGSYSRKHMKELQAAFVDAFGGDKIIPVSLSHGLAVLEKAYGLGKDASGNYLMEYLELRPKLMEVAQPLQEPPIYQHIPEAEIPEETLTPSRIQRLMEHALLDSWVLELEKMEPLVTEIESVETSPIFLSEHQQLARIEEIKEKWIRDSFHKAEKAVLKGRLEETAYLLFHLKEKELARLCLSVARSLERPESAFATNAFLKFLLDRTLDLLEDAEGQTEEEQRPDEGASPLILP